EGGQWVQEMVEQATVLDDVEVVGVGGGWGGGRAPLHVPALEVNVQTVHELLGGNVVERDHVGVQGSAGQEHPGDRVPVAIGGDDEAGSQLLGLESPQAVEGSEVQDGGVGVEGGDVGAGGTDVGPGFIVGLAGSGDATGQ